MGVPPPSGRSGLGRQRALRQLSEYGIGLSPGLVDAHRALDRAVDRAYRAQPFTTETNRVGFLFERYEGMVNRLGMSNDTSSLI